MELRGNTMNKASCVLRNSAILAFITAQLANTVLYIIGAGAFNMMPLLVVMVCAFVFGSILHLARVEDSYTG